MARIPVLFLCTANSARSQMAEGFVRHYASRQIEALSAGVQPQPIHPEAIEVMKEMGIDISHQRSRSVRELLGRRRFSHVIFVCRQAEQDCPHSFPMSQARESWHVEDPVRENAPGDNLHHEARQRFRIVRDTVHDLVCDWLRIQGIEFERIERST
ncbi:arsenate reductase ArsC [candidate division GN15 bacterium]|nr:arsenate reductase ArsC [candidate division GN15 bacterium]